jgi:GNAT superfamily N-acetyltransferase
MPSYLRTGETDLDLPPASPPSNNSNNNNSSNNKHNRFGLIDLFGGNRWVRPPKESTSGMIATMHSKQHESMGNNLDHKGLQQLPLFQHTGTVTPSEFFTLRMEHRKGGTLAKHAGEERVLLFRSDKAGAIAKVIFSSTPVLEESDGNEDDNDDGDVDDNNDDSSKNNISLHYQPPHPDDERHQIIRIVANATVHVLFVKDAYRGFNLGGLLFVLCTTCLRERYCCNNKIHSDFNFKKRSAAYIGMSASASSIRCRLDAEEDIRRHGKLVHFYEHLGLRKRKRAKATFINNNDGETYRRISMKMDLLVSPSSWKIKQQQQQQSDCNCNDEKKHLDDVALAYSSFLPALLVSASGECARVDNRSIDSWLIIECQDGTIELRTTDGRMLRPDGDNIEGRCKLVAPTTIQSSPCSASTSSSSNSGGFQLLRVSGMLEKVFYDKEEERSCIRDFKLLVPQDQQQNRSHEIEIESENELWMLRSAASCGTGSATFLGMTADRDLVVSPEVSFWQADEKFCLTHNTSDSPARRQHHRRMWKRQNVAYVSEMRKKHSAFALSTMTIEDALLDLAKYLPVNPFSSFSTGRRTKNEGSLHPSVRTMLFHTAELARKEGHPDWVQFVALVHGLAGVLTCLGSSNSNSSKCGSMAVPSLDEPPPGDDGKKEDDEFDCDFDWTIYVDTRVMGCKASKHSTFAEFRHLNSDRGDARYNTKNGLYNEHVGLEHVLLSWTSCDYMYDMLKHNHVLLPKEAYAILKLFPLVDWHTRGKHISLSNETDEERKPFVADFYEMFQRSRDNLMMMMMTNNNKSKEMMSDEECKELWTNHYSLIANKYGAGGILEW